MPTKIISKLARIWPTFFKLLLNKKDELYNIKKMEKWYIPNQSLRMLDVIRILLNEKLRWTFCSQVIDIFYQISTNLSLMRIEDDMEEKSIFVVWPKDCHNTREDLVESHAISKGSFVKIIWKK